MKWTDEEIEELDETDREIFKYSIKKDKSGFINNGNSDPNWDSMVTLHFNLDDSDYFPDAQEIIDDASVSQSDCFGPFYSVQITDKIIVNGAGIKEDLVIAFLNDEKMWQFDDDFAKEYGYSHGTRFYDGDEMQSRYFRNAVVNNW